MRSIWSIRVLLSILLLSACSPLLAQGWRATDIQLLYGDNFKLGDPSRTTVTLEHAQGWDWGDFYGFGDIYFRDDISTEFYGEAYLQFSLGALTGTHIAFGPITDIDAGVSFHAGDEPASRPFRAILAGMSLDLAVPGFRFVQFDLHLYKNDAVKGYGWQFTPVWDAVVPLGKVPLRFRGFLDVLSPKTAPGGEWQILTQPQLLVDAGSLAGLPVGHLYTGIEYSYWRNKYGIKGVTESVTQLMLMLAF